MSYWEARNGEEIKKNVKEHGVSGIDEFVKRRLDSWKNEDVEIGITGDSGAGKSSFINVLRE